LNREFGRKTLVGAVRRVRQPGCKFDTVLVLEGEQGIGKSSAIKILAGDYFRDDGEVMNKAGREVQELTCGVWLYEISELAGLTKRDVEHVKSFFGHTSARGAWGAVLEDQPRTCIFIGTCNRHDYLTDDTGNRRFWPMPLSGEIDLDALQRDRDQLWAEACAIEATGESLVLDRKFWKEVGVLTDSRLADDPWLATLSQIESGWTFQIDGKFSREFGEWRVASDWLLRERLDINPSILNSNHPKRLAACMRKLGWTGPKNLKINGHADQKGYTKALLTVVVP
jgi:predicted P-loop ATPase